MKGERRKKRNFEREKKGRKISEKLWGRVCSQD